MTPVSKHRSPQRALRRRGRAGALGLALAVTIAIGGAAVGVLPQLRSDTASADTGSLVRDGSTPAAIESAAIDQVAPAVETDVADVTTAVVEEPDPAVPADSGTGRRIVFDQSDQRVWLIDDDEAIERTYRVSGSRFDNLKTGTYAVQSKARHATAFDYSGTMEYFVRFATGYSEPIGFHSVPRDNDGKLEQTKSQLGTPLSAGCVRQWESDAVALWKFAPVGTTVVVTA